MPKSARTASAPKSKVPASTARLTPATHRPAQPLRYSTAMQIAIERAEYQPRLISMSSNVKDQRNG